MDIRHLIILHEVAQCGSITRAAAALNMSQPSLTRALQQLEQKAGLPLLERTRRGTTLTGPGEALVRHTRAILAELCRAEKEMVAYKTVGTERIHIGTMPAGSGKLLPEALLRFQRAFPTVAVSIVETTQALAGMLEDGELDLAIISQPVDSHNQRLTDETLVYDRLVVTARQGHPLLRQRIDLHKLAEADWALPMVAGKPLEEFENAFLQHGIEPPRRLLEIGSARTLRALLLSSDMIAPMLRVSIIDDELRGLLAVLPINLDLPVRRISLLTRTDVAKSMALETFVTTLREVSRELTCGALAIRADQSQSAPSSKRKTRKTA